MKYKTTALDDRELRDWLLDLIGGGAYNFLSALADVAVLADAEDCGVIRPALVAFRRKGFERGSKKVARGRFIAVRGTPHESQFVRVQKK